MELVKKNIHMEHHRNLASVQISLEEDQNISDQKPDVLRIICKKADVRITESKVQEDAVLIKGTVIYNLLYLTDEKEKKLCCIEGALPFEEKIYTNYPTVNDAARIVTRVDDLMIRLINSRKLNIRCIIAISMIQDELCDEEVVIEVDKPETCEILKKPFEITTIHLDTKDIFRMKEEVMVPDGFPNIYSLLWKNVRLEGLNFIPMEGRIGIQGEWNAFFLYEGEEEENIPRYFEVTRPFSGVLEMPDCKENMLLCVEWEAEQPQVEVRADYDGEDRLIGLDMELKLFVKLYQNNIISIVTDAYGLQEALDPVMRECICEHMVKKEGGKIKINESWENKENPTDYLQILHVDGTLIDESVETKQEEVSLAGVVHMEILTRMEDENNPYGCITIDIPYRQVLNTMGVQKESSHDVKVCIEQLQANVQGNHIDVRTILSYEIIMREKVSMKLLEDMRKGEQKEVEQELPVMSVYFAREGDNIWEIGKKYRVSLNGIREINQLKSDDLCRGQKILIAKEMT